MGQISQIIGSAQIVGSGQGFCVGQEGP